MATTIVQSFNAGAVDNAASMSNATWARPIALPPTWQKVRVGVRIWMTDIGTGPNSTPVFALGLCSGTANQIGDAQTTYFAGVVTNTSVWSYSGNPNFVYFSINATPCTKTGSVTTLGSNITTDARFSTTGSVGTLFFVDITKGSPNYTFNIFNEIASVTANVTAATFQAQMPLTSPVVTGYSFGTAQTLAVNETLSGSLNAVNCWWNHSDVQAQILDVAVAVIQ